MALQSLIKHKSKLEKAKEEAARQRKEQEARAKAAVGRSPVPPKGDWSERGIRAALGAGHKHKSRLQVPWTLWHACFSRSRASACIFSFMRWHSLQ